MRRITQVTHYESNKHVHVKITLNHIMITTKTKLEKRQNRVFVSQTNLFTIDYVLQNARPLNRRRHTLYVFSLLL